MYKGSVFILAAALALAGCDRVREQLHMLPNQDEQACLNTERLKFTDPEVLFVANLGHRGLEVQPDSYWVRYKTRNRYGAYEQGNMLCHKQGEKWVRDENKELLVRMEVSASLLEEENKRMAAEPGYRGPIFRRLNSRGDNAADIAYEMAGPIVLTSADPLTPYFARR